jgi:hypothetical protein
MNKGIIIRGLVAMFALLALCACGETESMGEDSTAVVEEALLQMCGGIAGTMCPSGYVCVDDPHDTCEPSVGADCSGICRHDTCSSDSREYVSRDRHDCAVIRFSCPIGMVPFSDHCGCGCE